MEITRDDENRRCIHAVLFGEHAGILQILTRVVRLFLLNDAVFVHALLYQILRHDVCFGVRLIRALRARDDDLRLRMIVQVGKRQIEPLFERQRRLVALYLRAEHHDKFRRGIRLERI